MQVAKYIDYLCESFLSHEPNPFDKSICYELKVRKNVYFDKLYHFEIQIQNKEEKLNLASLHHHRVCNLQIHLLNKQIFIYYLSELFHAYIFLA